MIVCKEVDYFLQDYMERNAHWEVRLNNGEYIYQDDDRPNVQPRSAWIRLREYCLHHNLHIIDMVIRFRDNAYAIPSNMDGYYFSLGARGAFGCPVTMHLFFVGTLQNGVLTVQCWKVPEMIGEAIEIRDPNEAHECLIQKNNTLPYTEH